MTQRALSGHSESTKNALGWREKEQLDFIIPSACLSSTKMTRSLNFHFLDSDSSGRLQEDFMMTSGRLQDDFRMTQRALSEHSESTKKALEEYLKCT